MVVRLDTEIEAEVQDETVTMVDTVMVMIIIMETELMEATERKGYNNFNIM